MCKNDVASTAVEPRPNVSDLLAFTDRAGENKCKGRVAAFGELCRFQIPSSDVVTILEVVVPPKK
jgi:hypothetical protein